MITIVIYRLQILKAAICYKIVRLLAGTLNIILKIPQKLWNVFTSSGTDVVGARQYSFEFNFSLRMRTIYNIYNVYYYILYTRFHPFASHDSIFWPHNPPPLTHLQLLS